MSVLEPEHFSSSEIGSLLSSLTFSGVIYDRETMILRMISWFNKLQGMQIYMPFFLVHDFGFILSQRVGKTIQIQRRHRTLRIAQERKRLTLNERTESILKRYQTLLFELARSDLSRAAYAQNISDDMVAAIIVKILEPVLGALSRERGSKRLPYNLELYEKIEPAHYLKAEEAAAGLSSLEIVINAQAKIRVAIAQIDIDALKLMRIMNHTSPISEASGILGMLQVLSSPSIHDIVTFSLELLPSVLETKRAKGSQTYALDGYSSIETKGTLDSLLPSELAYEEDIFEQRYLDKELFYYGHERQRENRDRLHYILIDASASMRGIRTVFARGLGLALIKKLSLRGDSVWVRFFDSCLYERQEMGSSPLDVPYLLCFRGEKGRNTTRVFSELDREIMRLQREKPREIIVTFITHGRSFIQSALLDRLGKHASLCGIFIMPSSGQVEVDYLERLNYHHTVEEHSLENQIERQSKALKILLAR